MRRSKTNYRRELQGKEPLQISLNCLFLGPSGTGKTTVAKLYAQILGELDLLSSNAIYKQRGLVALPSTEMLRGYCRPNAGCVYKTIYVADPPVTSPTSSCLGL